MAKRSVDDMSGFCRFPTRDGASHRHCLVAWETPSAIVTCTCTCHQTATTPPAVGGAVVVKKKRGQSLTV